MTAEDNSNKENVLALDMGSGWVKACFGEKKVRFPSLYGYREPVEGEKRVVEAVGWDVPSLQDYPSAVILRGVSEGMPLSERAFRALLKEVVRELEIPQEKISSVRVVIGIPYNNRDQKEDLRRLVMSTIRPAMCLVVSQTLGTLVYEKKRTGLVVSVGQGTTEIVYYNELKPVLGRSLRQACDYLLQGKERLAYLDAENKAISRQRIVSLADLVSDEINSITSQLSSKTDAILSGGTILLPDIHKEIQSRLKDVVVRPSADPIYSNCLGLAMLYDIIQSETRASVPN